jgi:hypothetical protein
VVLDASLAGLRPRGKDEKCFSIPASADFESKSPTRIMVQLLGA